MERLCDTEKRIFNNFRIIIMTFKINFTHNDGTEDYFYAEGETVADVQTAVKEEADRRGLDPKRNNLWSEKVG